jgi:hypothetical protein
MSMSDESLVNASLMDLAGQDAARSQVLRASLERLANGTGGELLQEMARDVLAGRLDLRQAALSDVYGSGLFDSFTNFWEHYERLSPTDQEQLAQAADAQLADIRDGISRKSDP